MSGKEKKIIENCIELLKMDGIDSKTTVSKNLKKLLNDHNKKWGK